MSEALSQFVKTFVQRDKQERFLSLLSAKRRRPDALWDLLHDGRHFDKSKFSRIEHSKLGTVFKELEKLGVVGLGYVLAVQGDFDDQLIGVSEVLESYLGRSTDVLAYFPIADAGYYENHEGEVYIFSGKFRH